VALRVIYFSITNRKPTSASNRKKDVRPEKDITGVLFFEEEPLKKQKSARAATSLPCSSMKNRSK